MRFLLFFVALLTFSTPQVAHAWWPQGHSIIARAATRTLPIEVPAWFRKGGEAIAHCAQDPDVQKNRKLPLMTEAEYPQHFIDTELLQGQPLPPTRAEFYKLCAGLHVEPQNVGELPYALGEWTQRLTMVFAEARRYPKNRFIQQKTFVYAGYLAHYAGDTTMPLHTTVDYDGRVGADGKSPQSGIHAKVDSLIEKVAPSADEMRPATVEALPDTWKGILEEIASSHALVDKTYSLESQLPPEKGAWQPSPPVRAFTIERSREATRFCAQLFLTAWRDSASIQLPQWLTRE